MNEVVTRNDLATRGMEALDRERVGKVQVSALAGGVSFASALEVMEFAKLMSTAQTAVPSHCRNNPGICLAVTFQAIEWRMSPFAVANKTYVVNDRLAFESQLVHAVIESRAPLKERLDCDYEGEGPTRQCTVYGIFTDDTQRDYKSPQFKDIKVKNSPLWTSDLDQQLFYYSSRSWARKWCPDVLLGIYTRDELAAEATLGPEEEPTGPGLKERLTNGDRTEGHKDGHARSELANIVGDGIKTIEVEAEKPAAETVTAKSEDKPARRGRPPRDPKPKQQTHEQQKKLAQAAADRAEKAAKPALTTEQVQKAADAAEERSQEGKQAEPAAPKAAEPAHEPRPKPTNVKEYQAWAYEWIAESTDVDAMNKRWNDERPLRNACGMDSESRSPIEEKLKEQRAELKK